MEVGVAIDILPAQEGILVLRHTHDARRGWWIRAEGRQPKKTLALEFPYDPTDVPDGMDPGQVMGVSSFNEDSGEWEPVPVSFDAEAHVMRAELDHLSWKWPWQWDWAGIGATINQRSGELLGKRAAAARCGRETEIPSWVQSVDAVNDDAIAMRSCAESEGDALVIEVVNNRPYSVVMHLDAPVKWTWVADPDDPADLVAKLVLDKTLPQDRLYIPALGRATIALKKGKWRNAKLSTDATGATIIATYLSMALGDLVSQKAAKLVAGPLAGGCLSGFIKTNADAVIDSLGDAHKLAASSADCVSEIMESRVLDSALSPEKRGRAATTYKALGKVSRYLTLFSTDWDSLDLLVDKALVAGASIIPIWTRPPIVPDERVPTELMGDWCTKDDSECVNFSDMFDEHPDGFFGNVYASADGSTTYSFCFQNDLEGADGEPGCTVAGSTHYVYFPAGLSWDCEAMAAREDYNGCVPDYTSEHDSSSPRLTHVPNHQQDRDYHDSPPMYRN